MLRRFLFSLVLLVAGFAAGVMLTARTESRASEFAPSPAPAQAPVRPAAAVAPVAVSAVGGMADFSKIAGQAVKGVANISSLQVVRTSNSPFGSDPFFRYFYDDDRAFGSRDRRSLSLGSGVMISTDGYVITNNHVVGDNVREITIALPDTREIR